MNEHDIKQNFNDLVKSEVMQKYTIYTSLGRNDYFVKIFAVKDFLITWENDWWQIAHAQEKYNERVRIIITRDSTLYSTLLSTRPWYVPNLLYVP